MNNEQIEPWDLVWSDVCRYDRDAARDASRMVFEDLLRVHGPLAVSSKPKTRGGEKLPPVVQWAGKDYQLSNSTREALTNRLRVLLPHWYGRDRWAVGNETFGGCWCHSLPKALTSGAEAGAEWVVTELDPMVSAMREWAAIIERVVTITDRAERVLVVHEATSAIIDVMIDRQWLSESWYSYADDGVQWMLQAATGLELHEPPLRDLRSSSFAFTSWTGPTSAQKTQFADAVAAIVERLG